MRYSVPERGSLLISAEDWASLSIHKNFWRLLEENILSVKAASDGRWELQGSCYIGRALIGSSIVEVREKFSGAFQTLVSLGALKAPKTIKLSSPINEASGSTAVLVALFIRSVRAYLSSGKEARYEQILDSGSLIGGRLSIRNTIRLRSCGNGHKAAFERTNLNTDIPINRCIYAALKIVERLGKTEKVSIADLQSARTLRMALSECETAILGLTPTELSKTAADLALQRNQRAETKDAISLAGAVLDAAGFGGSSVWERTVDHSWFVNLETFFEEAVRQVVRSLLSNLWTVTGPQARPSVFLPDVGRYRANPDVVMTEKKGAAISIADAKYKNFPAWPSTSDVYELLAHALAYKAAIAFLFYPSDEGFVARDLGESSTGSRVFAFGIRFEAFVADVKSALISGGLFSTIEETAAIAS